MEQRLLQTAMQLVLQLIICYLAAFLSVAITIAIIVVFDQGFSGQWGFVPAIGLIVPAGLVPSLVISAVVYLFSRYTNKPLEKWKTLGFWVPAGIIELWAIGGIILSQVESITDGSGELCMLWAISHSVMVVTWWWTWTAISKSTNKRSLIWV